MTQLSPSSVGRISNHHARVARRGLARLGGDAAEGEAGDGDGADGALAPRARKG